MGQGRGWWAGALFGCWVLVGCGDGDPHGTDGSPGTMVDASAPDGAAPEPDGATPSGDAGPLDAGLADGGPVADASLADAACDAAPGDAAPFDAGAGGPVIDAVATADGFTQARQGSSVVLVLRGSGLGDTDTVTVGELTASVIGAAPDEVRADLVVPHGTAPGPREVTASGPGGSASLADAIETTLYIVSPAGTPGGRGTFESPLALCDPEIRTATAGDTISLLAGEHVCDAPDPIEIVEGVAVVGAGRGVTLVRGAAESFPGLLLSGFVGGLTTALRGFTIVAPSPAQGVVVLIAAPGTIAVEDLGVEGPGVLLNGFQIFTAADLHVECGGSGQGLDAQDAATVSVTGSSFAGCQSGVSGGPSSWSLVDSVVERNDVGILGYGNGQGPSELVVEGCELSDNRTGIQLRPGSVARVTDTVIRDVEVTPEPMNTGIQVVGAVLELTGGEIVGHDQVGVFIFASVEGPSFFVTITDALVVGGTIGVDANGRDNPNALVMRDSVIRDQTLASVRIFVEWLFVTLDLGNGGGPGGNQLSVVSGIALLDIRENPDEFNGTIDARGMTLNGRSYAGQLIQGPASQPPDYSILSDGQIQF